MIDRPSADSEAPLNSYNVAQLHFALDHQDSKGSGIDSLNFDVHVHALSGAASPAILNTPQSSDAEIDYSSRRMSSSAASDSSLQSRPDKRAFDFSPSTSPIPKKSRTDSADHQQQQQQTWSSQTTEQQQDRSESYSNSNSPRVQLPSIASTFQDRHEGRRASLPTNLFDVADNRSLRLPHPGIHRSPQSTSNLNTYQFPGPQDTSDEKRPRISTDTQLGLYADYSSVPSTAISSSSSFSFTGNSPLSGAPSSVSDQSWASGIDRPSSTPNQHLPGTLSPSIKYDDSLRHSSLGGASSLYGGVTRISGQHHHSNASSSDRIASARNGLVANIKTENDWTFPSGEFSMSVPSSTQSMAGAAASSVPAVSVTSSPQRSPQAQAPASSLVDRPPRKRGKLPKPVTDFLKDWLHRHSDHPYPSEEEKKQLCHATGLSMSQVSNWMINARRRILAPAHRAAAGPTTNSPYGTVTGRSVLDTGRRASMPTDTLTLYHPLTLQSLPNEFSNMSSTRHLVGMTRSMSSSHASVGSLSAAASGHHAYGLDSGYSQSRLYGGSTLHPSQHVGSGLSPYSSVPMSAPASMSGQHHPFLGGSSASQQQQQQQQYSTHSHSPGSSNGYGGRVVTPDGHSTSSRAQYSFPDHGHSVSPGPGSGYNTPH